MNDEEIRAAFDSDDDEDDSGEDVVKEFNLSDLET